MDSMTSRYKSKDIKDKLGDVEICMPKLPRSASQGRPPSSVGGPRSKIPTNQNRVGSSLVDSHAPPVSRESSGAGSSTQNNARRLGSKSFSATLPKLKNSCAPTGMQQRALENQFSVKKTRYLKMKKELAEKQTFVQAMYEEVAQMREQLITVAGKDPGKVEGLCSLSYALNQFGDQHSSRTAATSEIFDTTINKDFISTLQREFEQYLKNFHSICENILDKHYEIVTWTENFTENHCSSDYEIKIQLDSCRTNMESLKEQLESAKKSFDDCNTTFVKKVTIMWTEIQTLRMKINNIEIIGDEVVNELRLKLSTENEKFNQLKEKKAQVDVDLAKAKMIIASLETRANTDESKISQLQAHVKSLEMQLKQKDISFESRTRELTNSLKNAEETIADLECQRETFEARFIELKTKDMEKSPRSMSPARRDETDDYMELYRDSQKKIQELEMVVESLRKELEAHKGHISKVAAEKLSSEVYLREQIEREQMLMRKMLEEHEQLKKEHAAMEQKIKSVDGQMIGIYPKEYDLKNSNKAGWSPGEIQRLNQDLHQETADLRHRNKELEIQLRQLNDKIKTQAGMIDYLHHRTNAKNPDARQSRAKVQERDEIAAKSEVLQQLYSTLEEKQMQVSRLEGLVKQMEMQELRAQEQRTRLEKRIAQLEVTLQSKSHKDYRNKKFNIL